MNYLDFTTILPLGAPAPDLSGQPVFQDFIPPQLWRRRLELQVRQARYNIAPEHDDPDVKEFREASRRWLKAVRGHAKTVETNNNIEFCNWAVRSTNQPAAGPIVWISHAEYGEGDHHPYTPNGARRLLNNPAAIAELPGWDQSSKLHRKALRYALTSFLQQETNL